jgi:hypothetical protein
VQAGDAVQLYLQYEETPEGDMLVSGQQAAMQRRSQAVWKELEASKMAGVTVKGEDDVQAFASPTPLGPRSTASTGPSQSGITSPPPPAHVQAAS